MSANKYVRFEGMTWPLPDNELSWRVLYAKASEREMLRVSFILNAYEELLKLTAQQRAHRVRHIKAAMKQARR